MTAPAPPLPRPPWRRRLWWAALLAVLVGHGLTTRWLGQALAPVDARPALERMQATYSRVLEVSAEPVSAMAAAAATPPPARAVAVARPASGVDGDKSKPAAEAARPDPAAGDSAVKTAEAASAPAASAPSAPAPDPAPEPMTTAGSASSPAPTTAEAPVSPAAVPPTAAASAPPLATATAAAPAASGPSAARPPAFTWPSSTRLRYALKGWFRGEVSGSAQVEWLRDRERYQVHLDVAVGPSFAPLMTRRMSSEGRLGAEGLMPQRYEQVTTQIIGRDKRVQLRFDDQGVLLDRGERVPTWPDVQDTASQFIQMVYLFTTRPALRAAGSRIEFALALPNRVDRWIYEVGVSEVVQTPAGAFQTFHVVPRRAAAKGDLSAEIWYAPTLQMLPVRIRITQDADTWIDLLLLQAPDVAS